MRKRATSDEERELFRAALKDAKPLAKRARVLTVVPKSEASAPRRRVDPPVYVNRPAPPIGGHRDAQLRRGRGEPEGRIDLHGMTRDHAYRTLMHFLLGAQNDDKKLVLVITGKGGVLRDALPMWLGQAELEGLVSGIGEAHMKHGGSGAFYVSLRRRRPGR